MGRVFCGGGGGGGGGGIVVVWYQCALGGAERVAVGVQTIAGVTAHGHPGWHGGLLSGWLPVLRSRSLVLVNGIHKGSDTLALRFPLLCNVLFFRP